MTTCSLWVCSCCMLDLSVGWAGSVQLSCLSLFEFYIEGLMRAPFICSWKSNRLQAAWSCRVGCHMSLGLASRASLSHYITWASTLDNDALLYSVHLLLTAWKYSSQIHSLTLLTRPPPFQNPQIPSKSLLMFLSSTGWTGTKCGTRFDCSQDDVSKWVWRSHEFGSATSNVLATDSYHEVFSTC